MTQLVQGCDWLSRSLSGTSTAAVSPTSQVCSISRISKVAANPVLRAGPPSHAQSHLV